MKVFFEEAGPADGPLVVLVHGMGDNRATWRLLVPKLVAAEVRAVAAKTPHATVAMLDGVGHYPHLERPAETAEVVLRFMATTARA